MLSSRKFWTASLAICTALLVGSEPLMAFAQPKFKAPRRGIPGRREPAGSREPRSCIEPGQDKGLMGLVPASNRSVTISSYPTFMVHVPKHRGKSVYFELRDETNTQVLHNVLINTSGQGNNKSVPGIYSVTLSPGSSVPIGSTSGKPDKSAGNPLEVNKTYLWYIVVNCGPIGEPQKDPANPQIKIQEDLEVYSGGWLRRIAPKPELTKKLERANPEEQLALYASNGIWNEAIATLAMLRRKNPDNQTYISDWKSFLKSVDLEAYSEQPLVDCCKPK